MLVVIAGISKAGGTCITVGFNAAGECQGLCTVKGFARFMKYYIGAGCREFGG
jgi:hypothetical protein